MKTICLILGTGMLLAPFLFFPDARAQESQEVTGVVIDSLSRESLPGVSVMEQGTSQGTSTDVYGRFSLEVTAENAILEFSFLGYRTKAVPAGSLEEETSIALSPDQQALDEVVVVGYGTQGRGDITGAVANVSSEKIKDLPVTGFDEALAGQVPGVQVQQGSGVPGSGPRITVRGLSSISADASPLYVIDGFPVGYSDPGLSNPLNFIAPQDIESISVLKDAASTAIYGSRGNGGVVMITTKQGEQGKPSISLDVYTGLQRTPGNRLPAVLNAREFAQFQRETIEDDIRVLENREPAEADIPEYLRDPAQYGEGTDWYDEIMQTAPIQHYNLSLKGGTENLKYYVSGGYFDQDGVIRETGYQRFSFRSNIEARIAEKLRFGLDLSPSYQIQDRAPTDPGGDGFSPGGAVIRAMWSSPAAPVTNPDGSYAVTTQSPFSIFSDTNPVWYLQAVTQERTTRQVLLNSFLEYEIINGLTLKSTFGINAYDIKDDYFQSSSIAPGWNMEPPSVPVGNLSNEQMLNYLNENTLNYSTTLDEVHRINAVAGFTVQKEKFERNFFSGRNFPNDELPVFHEAPIITGESDVQEWALVSYLARVNYIYDDKYIITTTFRTDGSSRFGSDSRWGYFPSVSLGWRVSEENFFQNLSPAIDDLKIKASYGITGNNGIGNYAALGTIGNDNYVLDGSFTPGSTVTDLPNPALGWEKSRQADFGFEAGFLNNRIFLVADFYQGTTRDLLFSVPVATISGFSTSLTNIGEVRNRGMEFTLSSRNVVGRDFTWSTDLNIAFNRNTVLALGSDNEPIREMTGGDGSRMIITEVGQPVGMFYGLQYEGLYTQDDMDNPDVPKYNGAHPGSAKFLDANGNGIYEREPDHVIIGDPNPDFTFGLTNNFTYRHFDLNIIMVGAYGQDILDASREINHNLDGVFNVSREVLDRYRPGDDPATKTVPTTVGNTAPWRNPNSTWIKDGSYLSVRNITLGYTFGSELLAGSNFIRNTRLYLSVQNAFLFTPFEGNPEINRVLASPRARNISYGSYPVPRTFTLGANISF